MNLLLVLGSGSLELLLLTLALLLALPALASVVGLRQLSYARAFFVAAVLSLLWLGLVALFGESVLGTVFDPIGRRPPLKALLLDFGYAVSLFLLAAFGQWLRVRQQRGTGVRPSAVDERSL